jgi:hypothetical protein
MPRPRNQSALDSRISSIAQNMAAALVRAVREHLADEVAKVIGGRNGRANPNGHSKRASTRRRRGVSEGVLEQLLKVTKTSPGLRSEEIYRKLPQHSPKILKAGLAKLREQKKVKTSGERRSTTYRTA